MSWLHLLCCMLISIQGGLSSSPFESTPPTVQCLGEGFKPTLVYNQTANQVISLQLYFGSDPSANLCSNTVRNDSADAILLSENALPDPYNETGFIPYGVVSGNGSMIPTCGGLFQHWNDSNIEKIKYEVEMTAIVTRTYRGKIERKLSYPFLVHCSLERDIGPIRTNNSFRADGSVTTKESKNVTGQPGPDLPFNMGYFTDETFTTPITGTVSAQGSPLYLQIDLGPAQSLYMFAISQCQATIGPDLSSTPERLRDTFFDNGCNVDRSMSFKTTDQGIFQLIILPFEFINEPGAGIFLHCDLHLCIKGSTDPKCTSKTADQCPSALGDRRRRSARDIPDERRVESKQPIIFDRSLELFPPSCENGIVYDRQAQGCSDSHLIEVQGIHIRDEIYHPLYANSSSTMFKRLAQRKEAQLYMLLKITGNHKDIRGVKVLRVRRPENIVTDILVKHDKSLDGNQAFKVIQDVLRTPPYVSRLVNKFSSTEGDRMKYIVVNGMDEAEKPKLHLLVAVIVAIVVVAVVVAIFLVVLWRMRKAPSNDKQKDENTSAAVSPNDMATGVVNGGLQI